MPVATTGLLLAMLRLVLFVGWTVIVVPVALASKGLRGQTAAIRVIYLRGLCKLFGIDVIVHGTIAESRPLLIASNHVSYLDVLAFGAVGQFEFVSKAEVASWPAVGALAKLGDTVFIERRRTKTRHARDGMSERLAANRRLIFFPEATSGDGNRLLPFKSALFTVAEPLADGTAVTVQPAAIAYTRLNGLPTGFGWRSFFAWYGDMSMPSHVWRFLQLGSTTVEIAFLNPIPTEAEKDGPIDRKALALAAERASRHGFNCLLSGRDPL